MTHVKYPEAKEINLWNKKYYQITYQYWNCTRQTLLSWDLWWVVFAYDMESLVYQLISIDSTHDTCIAREWGTFVWMQRIQTPFLHTPQIYRFIIDEEWNIQIRPI